MKNCFGSITALLLLAAAPCWSLPDDALSDTLRLNEIQVIGTHNSYHLRPDEDKLEAFRLFDPEEAATWEYSHAPLFEQLEAGVRAFELDLNFYEGEWSVFHVPNVDENSSCRVFVDCLQTIRQWSEANPSHVPITVLLEIKEDSAGVVGKTEEITDDALRNLESVVKDHIESPMLLSPRSCTGDGTIPWRCDQEYRLANPR